MNRFEIELHHRQGQRSAAEKMVQELEQKLADDRATLTEYKLALDCANAAMIATQTKVKTFIEEVVSLAVQSVFGTGYRFVVDYVVKRNKSEAQLYIEKEGERRDIEDESGGGVCDVCAVGLRAALYVMAKPSPNNVLLLDEPGTRVSQSLQASFAEMLKKISEVLGLQLVVVSHSEDIINSADKTFLVEQHNKISTAKEV